MQKFIFNTLLLFLLSSQSLALTCPSVSQVNQWIATLPDQTIWIKGKKGIDKLPSDLGPLWFSGMPFPFKGRVIGFSQAWIQLSTQANQGQIAENGCSYFAVNESDEKTPWGDKGTITTLYFINEIKNNFYSQMSGEWTLSNSGRQDCIVYYPNYRGTLDPRRDQTLCQFQKQGIVVDADNH